jgi:ATP-dependent 26S proteasome regulatory subunit
VLSTLLNEMDGVAELGHVTVIGCTSDKSLIDPAVLRPGRLDVQIEVPVPALADRVAILAHAASQMPLDADADVHTLAARTAGFSGAKLQALVQDAAVVALRRDIGASTVQRADLEVSLQRWLEQNAALGFG